MPAEISPNIQSAAGAPYGLQGYDNAVEDFLRDIPISNGEQDAPRPVPLEDDDKEVQVKRQRKPNPKLDEDRCATHSSKDFTLL